LDWQEIYCWLENNENDSSAANSTRELVFTPNCLVDCDEEKVWEIFTELIGQLKLVGIFF
jgi:hypothetical protein